jgi:hypothetical protein
MTGWALKLGHWARVTRSYVLQPGLSLRHQQKSLAHYWRKLFCATSECALRENAGAFWLRQCIFLLAH